LALAKEQTNLQSQVILLKMSVLEKILKLLPDFRFANRVNRVASVSQENKILLMISDATI
jgi:hypothetical protein